MDFFTVFFVKEAVFVGFLCGHGVADVNHSARPRSLRN